MLWCFCARGISVLEQWLLSVSVTDCIACTMQCAGVKHIDIQCLEACRCDVDRSLHFFPSALAVAAVSRLLWIIVQHVAIAYLSSLTYSVLCSLVVKASDLRLNGRQFDPRPPHYRSVGTGMGDRLHNQPPRPTQPPTLCGTGNDYRPKCGDALRLGSKGRFFDAIGGK